MTTIQRISARLCACLTGILMAFAPLALAQASAAPDINAQPLRTSLNEAAHDRLEQHFAGRLQASLDSLRSFRALNRDMEALAMSSPASLVPFDRWVHLKGSGVAVLARAEFLRHRAWAARGDKFARETHRDNFARMERLMAQAQVDYEAALAQLGPRCDLCHSGLLESQMLLGQRAQAVTRVDAAMLAMSGGMATPLNYLRFLQPRWGGSWQEMERFVDRFASDFPAAPGVRLLRGALLAHRADAWLEAGDAQQARLLLEEALRLDPESGQLWDQLSAVGQVAGDSKLILSASAKALAINPQAVGALIARSGALLRGPHPLDAVPWLEQAAALGDDWALQTLLPIVAAGRHGFKPDRERAQRICQSAIDAQRPAGFACMGGLAFFGIGRAPDKPAALRWFVEAAERGVASSMVDAGLMLWRGDGVPRDPQRAIGYWLRAHEAGDPRADAQLKSNLSAWAYWRQVVLPVYQARALSWLGELHRWLQILSAA